MGQRGEGERGGKRGESLKPRRQRGRRRGRRRRAEAGGDGAGGRRRCHACRGRKAPAATTQPAASGGTAEGAREKPCREQAPATRLPGAAAGQRRRVSRPCLRGGWRVARRALETAGGRRRRGALGGGRQRAAKGGVRPPLPEPPSSPGESARQPAGKPRAPPPPPTCLARALLARPAARPPRPAGAVQRPAGTRQSGGRAAGHGRRRGARARRRPVSSVPAGAAGRRRLWHSGARRWQARLGAR